MEEPSCLDRSEFAPSLFSGSRKELAKALATLRAKSQPPTPHNVLLLTKDEDLSLFATKLRTRSLGGSFDMLVERLREVRTRAKVASVCRKHYDKAYDEKNDFREAVAELEKDVMGIRSVKTSSLSSGSDYQDVLSLIEWRNANPDGIRGICTGFQRLDEVIDGIQPRYYIIGGRPSAGKTALAMNVCESLLLSSAESRVLFFSAETSSTILKERMLSIASGVPIGRIGRSHTPIERERIRKAIIQISSYDWLIDETSSPSISHMEAIIRRVHREKPITAVIGDYVQLFTGRGNPGGKKNDRRNEIAEVSAGCKGITKDLNIPVIMLAQLQRPEGGVYDRTEKKTITPRPQLHSLKECGDLEQDADVVALLYRNQEENSSKAELIVAKQKDGPLETINLTFKPETYSFSQA
jgi:replicative DNA helicase